MLARSASHLVFSTLANGYFPAQPAEGEVTHQSVRSSPTCPCQSLTPHSVRVSLGYCATFLLQRLNRGSSVCGYHASLTLSRQSLFGFKITRYGSRAMKVTPGTRFIPKSASSRSTITLTLTTGPTSSQTRENSTTPLIQGDHGIIWRHPQHPTHLASKFFTSILCPITLSGPAARVAPGGERTVMWRLTIPAIMGGSGTKLILMSETALGQGTLS